MTSIVPSGSKVMRPPDDRDGQLLLTLTQRDEVVTPGSSSIVVVNDANVTRTTPATTDTAWDVAASANHFGRIVPVSLSCSVTGAISNGRLTRVSDGACLIVASSGMFFKSQAVSMLRSSGQTIDTWQSWVAGSLASSVQQTTDVAIPFWRGSGFGFTAVSPRHVIGCEHIYYMPPSLTLGGVTRNLVSSQSVGPANGSDNWKSDLMIGLYDGDFPSFAKVFPADLLLYIPSLAIKGVAVVVCNQFGQKLQRMTGAFSSATSKLNLAKINPGDPDIIGGDSGNPVFVMLGGEPVLLGTLTYGGIGIITTIHDQLTAINSAMTTLGGGYQLTQFDLSGFPSYA